MRRGIRVLVVLACSAAVVAGCRSGGSEVPGPEDPARAVRGSPFVGCFELEPGPWDDGRVLHQGIRRPRRLRLDAVPRGIPLHAAFRARIGPPVGAGLDHVGWWPSRGDSAVVYATDRGWAGYMMRLAMEGDSIRGRGEEVSDVVARYRAHAIVGVRVSCTEGRGGP